MSDIDRGATVLAAAGVRFRPDSGELTGPGGAARLAPQPAELLALLVVRAGEVVPRDDIRERLWPGGRVEFDQGIAFAVREIRKGLEEVGADPALVETLPRRGFRVARARSGAGAEPGPGGSRRGARALRPVALGVLVGLALGLGVWRIAPGPRDAPPAPVVVVFPHDVAEGAPVPVDVEALAEAVTTRLTADLGGEAGVIGPTGTVDLGGPDDTDAARDVVGACLVLSGSVRPAGPDSVVAFTQLVRTSDRVHVWARQDTLAAGPVARELAAAAVSAVRDALAAC